MTGQGVETPHERAVVCTAHRQGRRWYATASDLGVHTHGRTLTEIAGLVADAAALALDTAPEEITVEVVPVSAELDAVAQTRSAAAHAQTAAVRKLRSQGVTWPDVARSVGVPQHRARALARRESQEEVDDAKAPVSEPVVGEPRSA
ncbi:hypothetical protein CLV63_1295 [Murinocardiopsis flavida]|uniref:Uncharacterized protein n=1 Tax=Murinocardiopsis flavida TaxID=645275 RepID=A0A2P8CUU8_9ACTN|nr:hypothetical protein [Murinocardiopsis flavida]PSK88719.1 hypothetical protein CLV63_1295 [Murinocardiopsis flavida]